MEQRKKIIKKLIVINDKKIIVASKTIEINGRNVEVEDYKMALRKPS